ncbi:phosphatase PAP2 family protein [Cryobacterium sp. TMT1-2-2]|nr:phosphatase PAP2 family protein [Cryobacterium sp. TMT1-2-2]
MSAFPASSDPRARLARLPQLRWWISVSLLLVLVTLILGFAVKLNPRLSGAEFRIDELLSRDHLAVGNTIALTINAVLSPPGIILILLVLFAFLLIVRRSPVNAFAVTFAIAIYFIARGTRGATPAAIIGLGFALLVAGSRLYLGVHYPSDVLGSFLVAPAAICIYTGLWTQYGMHILNWIPFLDRIGPIPPTPQPRGRPATRPSAPETR